MLRSLFVLAATLGVVNNAQKGDAGTPGAAGAKGETGAPGGVPAMLFGAISAAGAKVSGSPGWTVVRTETGVYKVTITVPFASFSTPVACVQNSAAENRTAMIKEYLAGSFQVEVLHNGVRSNDNINFFCSGG